MRTTANYSNSILLVRRDFTACDLLEIIGNAVGDVKEGSYAPSLVHSGCEISPCTKICKNM